MRRWVFTCAVAACAGTLGACGRPLAAPRSSSAASLHARGIAAESDPTVRGARLLPEHVEEDRALGVEPGGGVRAIAAGIRVVSLSNGAMLASDQRLPETPLSTVAVPERLGGGFLFVLGHGPNGSVVWRADRWLAEARPIHKSDVAIQKIVFGLDRVYLRAANGATTAIDGRTGESVGLGPWPGSSFVGAYAAADGWRAVAINDLRGAVATFDAGATWRPLGLPLDVKDVRVLGDAIVVGGLDTGRETAWYEVRPDGQLGRLGAFLSSSGTGAPAPHDDKDAAQHSLGRRPLAAAIEDGWPLPDGTAVIARDGALSRVRLSDGAIVDHAPDAFPLKPSRCHPVPFGAPGERGAFGFVCGEVRGPTVVYAYDPSHAALVERVRFERPRVVLAFGNGALAVKGSCEPLDEGPSSNIAGDARPDRADEKPEHTYCLLPPGGAPRPLRVMGSIDGERLVLLHDGRVAVISPPHGDLGMMRLTVLAGAGDSATTVPIVVRMKDGDPAAPLAGDVARALRSGVWLEGFEERRPGVLGGWIDAAGAVLGIEIGLDGNAVHGPFIHDAGSPMVSGRYGLGWSMSRRGVETTDGGMSWTPLDLPEPLVATRAVAARACGPVGCSAAGWLRVGWGGLKTATPSANPPPARPRTGVSTEPLVLACEPTAPAPPPPPEAVRAAQPSQEQHTRATPWGTAPVSVLADRNPGGMDLPPFYVTASPLLRPDERGLTSEASERVERAPRTGPLARFYAWGPRTGEWEHAGKWLARWVTPFGGWQDVHSSLPAPAPQLLLEAARLTSPSSLPVMATWQLGVGDDGAHAILVARRSTGRGSDASLFELEEARAPVELRRADGEAFTEIDAMIRAGGRWYVATPPTAEWNSTVWQIDGSIARELARIPRAGMDMRPSGARLARRTDGRVIGLVVDGQPVADHPGAQRWVVPIDVETGALGEPEPLGAADLSDRREIALCGEDDSGWVMDTPWNVGTRLYIGGKFAGGLSTVDARVRVTTTRACVERIAGTMGALSPEQTVPLTRTTGARAPVSSGSAVPVVAISANSRTSQMRYSLRCTRR